MHTNINLTFLNKLQEAFYLYLSNGARSNEKLKPVHSFISDVLKEKLDDRSLNFYSLSPNKKGGEKKVIGRYMDKDVDIAVCSDDKVLGAIGFKFVMSNYKQNSNNYFENMLGETANIRSNKIPYFQILVLLNEFPYYQNGNNISKWEQINERNLDKYVRLAEDNIDTFFHTPTKTLIYIVSLPKADKVKVVDKKSYSDFYKESKLDLFNNFNKLFGAGVIVNDFENFVNKVSSYIQFAK